MNGYLYVWSFTYMVILCCSVWWHLINLIVTKRLQQREATYLLISNYVSKGRQLFVISNYVSKGRQLSVISNYVRCFCDNEWRFVLGINIQRVRWKTVVTAFLFHIKLQQFPPFSTHVHKATFSMTNLKNTESKCVFFCGNDLFYIFFLLSTRLSIMIHK